MDRISVSTFFSICDYLFPACYFVLLCRVRDFLVRIEYFAQPSLGIINRSTEPKPMSRCSRVRYSVK